MSWSTSDDARLRAWLDASAPEAAPRSILEATYARTRATRRSTDRRSARRPRWLLLVAAGLAILAFALGAALVAWSPRPVPIPQSTLPEPQYLGDLLWNGGYAFAVDAPPADVVDAGAAAAAAARDTRVVASFIGPADPPIFGRLRCVEPGLCGAAGMMLTVPPDDGTTDTWSVWVVEYPEVEGYRLLSARDGGMITGWDGEDLSSCSADEVGTEPYCTADSLEPPREIPTPVNYALARWGQTIPYVEWAFSTTRDDNEHTWPPDILAVDPMAVASTLVTDPTTVDAFQGSIACERAACPDGIVTQPGEQRTVAVVVVDDGARWVIVDATAGETLASDETPVPP